MDYKLATHFYLKHDKKNVKDQSPVYMRITLNGQRTEICTNQSIQADNWNKRIERAKGNREEIRIFNNYLDTLLAKVKKCFTDLLDTEEYFDVNDLKNSINGKGKSNRALVQAYEESIKLMKQQVGSKYVNHTIWVYEITIKRLKEFIDDEYGVQDIALRKLDYHFIQRYEIFLRAKHKCQHNTTMKYLKQLKP